MPEITARFTYREVIEALKKAGWENVLPPADNLENPDEVCVEITSKINPDES